VIFLAFLIGTVKSLVPTGATSAITFRRALERRYVNALAVAVGGSVMDSLYCLAAVLGLSMLASGRQELVESVRGLGIGVLFAVGLYMALRPPRLVSQPTGGSASGWWKDLLLGLSTTGFNPTLIVTWTLAIGLLTSVAGMRFSGHGRVVFPIGVLAGTLTGNGLMVLAVRRLEDRLEERHLTTIARGLGVLLIALAGWRAAAELAGRGPS
jgi:threonine/homoserine/homoserine lactone efflux protein